MGLEMFQNHVICADAVNERLQTALLSAIHRERSGERVNRMLLKNCLSMLVDVDPTHAVYRNNFEDKFLEETRAFYQHESQDFIAHNNCPDYLRKVLPIFLSYL